MAEFTSIAGALVTLGRCANMPYFGKRGNIWPYSPCEQKRKAIRSYLEVPDTRKRKKKPKSGLLRMRIQATRGNGTALVPCIQEK